MTATRLLSSLFSMALLVAAPAAPAAEAKRAPAAGDASHARAASEARRAEPAGEARQAQLDLLRDAIRANKRALVAVNLPLTDEEAGRFWPIYDRYEGELRALNDRLVKLLDEYSSSFPNLSDDRAAALIGEYLGVEADRSQLRRTYLPEFSKALPGRKVARFYQIENKMDAVVRYDMAAHVPVVEP